MFLFYSVFDIGKVTAAVRAKAAKPHFLKAKECTQLFQIKECGSYKRQRVKKPIQTYSTQTFDYLFTEH